jgi:hypothetical protein
LPGGSGIRWKRCSSEKTGRSKGGWKVVYHGGPRLPPSLLTVRSLTTYSQEKRYDRRLNPQRMELIKSAVIQPLQRGVFVLRCVIAAFQGHRPISTFDPQDRNRSFRNPVDRVEIMCEE